MVPKIAVVAINPSFHRCSRPLKSEETRVKVALVSLHFAEYASRLALALDAHHDVLLILASANGALELSGPLRDALVKRGNVIWFGRQGRRSAVFHTIKLLHEIRRFRPDVIHIQEVENCVPTWVNDLMRYSTPLVVTVHDPVCHGGEDDPTYRRRLRARANRLIVHGEKMVKELGGKHPALTHRIASLPHGMLGDEQGGARTDPERTPVFLFFGRIEAYKGLGLLLQAGELLAAKGLTFRLVIAGTGSALDQHRQQIQDKPWAELIDRHIHADEIPQIFARASAVVLPYAGATQSGVAALAFGLGRPVVATNVGGLADIIQDGYNGFLVPPRDAAALAAALERFIVNERLCEQLLDGVIERARREMNWDVIARQTSAVYDDALRAHATDRRASSPFTAGSSKGHEA